MVEARAAFAVMRDEIRTILLEIGPQIRESFITALRLMSHWLNVATRAVVMLAEKLRAYFNIGTEGKSEPSDLRVAASAQRVQISNIGDYQRQLQIAAFTVPGSSKEDKQLQAL